MAEKHTEEFKRDAVRIALTSGLTRKQVASDLGVGLSTLGKWISRIRTEDDAPIPPFLMGFSRRIHAAVFNFIAGVIPPMAMLGRSLL